MMTSPAKLRQEHRELLTAAATDEMLLVAISDMDAASELCAAGLLRPWRSIPCPTRIDGAVPVFQITADGFELVTGAHPIPVNVKRGAATVIAIQEVRP